MLATLRADRGKGRGTTMDTTRDPVLARLGDEYLQSRYAADPFAATADGVPGYDDDVPDPSRAAAERLRERYGAIADGLSQVDSERLDGTDAVSHAVLARRLRDERDTLRFGLEEVAVTAGMAGALAGVVAILPIASVAEPEAARRYLTRLGRLGGYFDALGRRQLAAKADGRFPTATGVRQAVAQIDNYLSMPPEADPLLRLTPGPDIDAERWRAEAAELTASVVRPALSRYRNTLVDELLPAGRPDDRVGVGHVPDGAAGYLAQVRAHTTTELTPEEIHQIGLDLVASLREEFAERGGRALDTSDVPEVVRRLRNDPALRFSTATEIVDTVTGALRSAEDALPDWFRRYDV